MMIVDGHLLVYGVPEVVVGVTRGTCKSRKRPATCTFFIVSGLTAFTAVIVSVYIIKSVMVCV